uniref:Uncharacterized protein n=1 Tax=Octopus bimaculoides TaxID=37653 RepID=A0A0L8HIP2_OCTBM
MYVVLQSIRTAIILERIISTKCHISEKNMRLKEERKKNNIVYKMVNILFQEFISKNIFTGKITPMYESISQVILKLIIGLGVSCIVKHRIIN